MRSKAVRVTALALIATLAAAFLAGLLGSRGSSAHQDDRSLTSGSARPTRTPPGAHPTRIPRGAHPARLPPGALALAVSATATGRPIPPGFLGLSLEYTGVEPYAGRDPNAINPVFLQLIRNLTPGQDPVLRIGGDTTDWTWWPVPGMARPPGIRYTLSTRWLGVTAALTRALHARLILGLNLEAGSAAVADTEARALIAGLGRRSIEALELGNEPELYGTFGWYRTPGGVEIPGRPSDYNFARYTADYSRLSLGLPRLALAGPATGAPKWIPGLGSFLAAEPRVTLATLHRYPLRRCFAPAASANHASIARLLAPDASHGLADTIAPYVRLAHARHISLRIDELNSVSCGGAGGVSNVFASALWALDTMFSMARVGVDGVNVHTLPQAPYGLFNFKRRRGRWTAVVAPDYYGLLMFAQATPPGSRLLDESGQMGDIRAWATRTPDGFVHVVLINDNTATSRLVAVRVPGARGMATVERLRAPSIAAHAGVTLGGQSFGSSNTTGTLRGRSALTLLAPAGGGVYIVRVPKASAAMLTLASTRLSP